MNALRIPAVFARGGTSKAVIFKAADLPADQAARDRIFTSTTWRIWFGRTAPTVSGAITISGRQPA